MTSAPALRARWCAYRGEGAYRNGKRIQVSLGRAMVFTTGGGPSKGKEAQERIRRLADAARNARALGGF
jgi:fructose-1,6-bisphosphatase/inositol monophosphatase family enzyme